jgi:hypothetical protein
LVVMATLVGGVVNVVEIPVRRAPGW